MRRAKAATTLNKDILVLREVIGRLTPLLAGQGLVVTQRGTQAYVATDPKTLKPVRVNIPHIPDNAGEDMILAIQGFIDHEVGHCLFTEWSIIASIADNPKLKTLHNIVEDPFVERKIGEKFPGSVRNIDLLHGFFIEKITKPALEKVKGDLENEFRVLLVPIARAWAGQRAFQEFMDANGYWEHPMVKKFADAMPKDAVRKFPKIKSTTDGVELAQIMLDVLSPPKKEEPPVPKDEEKTEKPSGKEGSSEEKADDPDGEGAAEEKPEDEDDKGTGGEDADEAPESDAEPGEDAPEEDEGAPDPGPEHESDEDDETEPAGEDEPEPETEDEAEDDEPAPEKGDDDGDDGASDSDEPGPEGDKGDSDDDGAIGAGEDEEDMEADATSGGKGDSEEKPSDDGDKEPSREPKKGEGSGETPEQEKASSPFDAEIDVSEEDTFEGGLSKDIGDEAVAAMSASDYAIYTRDFDRIEVLEPGSHYKDAWLTKLDDETLHMVGPMQKDLERLMAARSQVMKVPGYRSGKLHGAGLYKLSAGDDRIFRRRFETKATETAVCLLIDNSGSMMGAKMKMAMAAGYALSTTLDRVRVPNEALGFTTDELPDRDIMRSMEDEERRIGRKFTRDEPIYMPIFKQFAERMTPAVRKRFAAAPYSIPLRNNIDGECIEIAALSLLKRPERRKVLMVLSDGAPCCSTPSPRMITAHTKLAVQKAEAAGVETIGIGIMDNSVTYFYPKNVVLRDLADLPRAVMGELRHILLK